MSFSNIPLRNVLIGLVLIGFIFASLGAVAEIQESTTSSAVVGENPSQETIFTNNQTPKDNTDRRTVKRGDQQKRTDKPGSTQRQNKQWGEQLPESTESPNGIMNNGARSVTMKRNTGAGNGDGETSSSGRSSEEVTYSTDSIPSYVGEEKFTTTGLEQTYWKTGTVEEYNNGEITSTSTTVENVNTLPNIENRGEGVTNNADGNIMLHQSASRIPASDGITGVRVKSGANPEQYNFKRGRDGSIVVTTQDGELTSLPKGTELAVTTRSIAPNEKSGEIRIEHTESTGSNEIKQISDQIVTENNAETRREKATAIRDWLKQNKEYNTSATYEDSQNPTEEFLTSNTGGSSKHFSAAATAMLREQNVPSRVGVGYNKPQRTQAQGGDSVTYETTDQYAWSEYNTGDGWERIDPTPQERDEAIREMKRGDESATSHGVPQKAVSDWANQRRVVTGESTGNSSSNPNNAPLESVASNNDATSGETTREQQRGGRQPAQPQITDDRQRQNNQESATERAQPPYNVTVTDTPVPGRKVTVIISKASRGVAGVGVEFNGEYIGRTNNRGRISAVVPYEETLIITPRDEPGVLGGSFDSGAGEEFELPNDVSVNETGVVLPGKTVPVEVMVDGELIPGVDVYIDGENIGRTNNNGVVEYTVPESVQTGDVLTVSVSRGGFDGAGDLAVATPKLIVDGGVIPLPMTELKITTVAEDNGEEKPLPDENVDVVMSGVMGDEERSVTTDENGTVSLSIPFVNSVTASATLYGEEKTGGVSGIYYWVGGVLLPVIVGCVGVGVVMQRRGITPMVVIGWVMGVLFMLAEKTRVLGRYVSAAKQYIVLKVKRVYEWVIKHGIRSKRTLVVIYGIPNRVKRVLLHAWRRIVHGFHEQLNRWVSDVSGKSDEEVSQIGEGEVHGSVSASERIRRVWKMVVSRVTGESSTTWTTVELSEKAVNMGVPKNPVVRVRDAYQEVRYGGKNAEKRVRHVQDVESELQSNNEVDSE